MLLQAIDLPDKQPTLRVIPMIYDTNPRGDIFGGWLMSQIDKAGALAAHVAAKGLTATISVKNLSFEAPLFVGDIVSLYAEATRIGKKSVDIRVEVYAERENKLPRVVKVSHAELVYVAIVRPGESRMIPQS